ncbi:MAG TPA: LysE family transporter [Flavobacterium sp.]|nr:LysE family transporter [Flavobacterium sp.]
MANEILTAIYLGILLSFLIGPVFFVLLETSVTKGFRAAMVFDFGVIAADILFIIVAYFSSYRLIESIKDEPALFIFGGLIMVTYGIISFVKLKSNKVDNVVVDLGKKNYFALLGKGFLLNFINVGVLGFWLMILIIIGPMVDMETGRIFTFFTVILLTYLTIDIGKILLAKRLKNKLTIANITKVKKFTSFILMIFGVGIMLQGWFPSEQKMVRNAIERMENKNRVEVPPTPASEDTSPETLDTIE